MNPYRIIRIAGLHYKSAVRLLFSEDGLLGSQSYEEMQKALFQKGLTYGNGFSRGMQMLGHEAHEIVYDLEEMQKTWARENRISYRETYWQWDILLAQIQRIKPDVLFFQDFHSLPFTIRSDLKRRFPFLKLVVIFRGFPGISPNLSKELSTADVLLAGSPILMDYCLSAGLAPRLVYHYFDESLLDRVPLPKEKKYEFTFLGSSGVGYGLNHQPRYAALKELLTRTQIELWVDEMGSHNAVSFKKKAKAGCRKIAKAVMESAPSLLLDTIRGIFPALASLACEVMEERQYPKTFLPKKPLHKEFPARCRPPAFGLDLYKTLALSKVTFNKHAAAACGTVDNIRLFQATGMGTCLLTDYGRNIRDLFDPDREVLTYHTIDECVEKVSYLLHHDQTLRSIADAGQKRVLRDHTAAKRCEQMDEIFQESLKKYKSLS